VEGDLRVGRSQGAEDILLAFDVGNDGFDDTSEVTLTAATWNGTAGNDNAIVASHAPATT
jgi:hypothetical protein